MQSFCNHFATTKNGNPLFKRIPTIYRLFKLFPREVSSNQKCLFYAAFRRIYFIKCYSFHVVFKNFSSKLVAIIQYCIYKVHGRYNLLLLLKTNKFLWLSGYLLRLLPQPKRKDHYHEQST